MFCFCHPKLVEGFVGLGLLFYLLLDQRSIRSVFIHTFFLIKKYAKTQGRTMLLHTGLYLGPPFCRAWLFFVFSFCHPELVEGFGKLLLSSCNGAVAGYTVAVRTYISVVRLYTATVSKYMSTVRYCTDTVTSFIGAVASCTVAVRHCTATLSGVINLVKVYTNKVSMYGYF